MRHAIYFEGVDTDPITNKRDTCVTSTYLAVHRPSHNYLRSSFRDVDYLGRMDVRIHRVYTAQHEIRIKTNIQLPFKNVYLTIIITLLSLLV